MIDEKAVTVGGALIVTLVGGQIIANQLQIQPLPEAAVQAAETVSRVVLYGVAGLAGLAAMAGLFFAVRHALRSWPLRQLVGVAAGLIGVGLYLAGANGGIPLLIGAGIACVWVSVLAVTGEDERKPD